MRPIPGLSGHLARRLAREDSDTRRRASRAAREALRAAHHRLLQRYPLHARLLGGARLVESWEAETIGVRRKGMSIELVFSPRFVLRCTVRELVGVLLHEGYHKLFGHLDADRSKFPILPARRIAEEVTANEFIREPLPGAPILLSTYPELPPYEDTETRYLRLIDLFEKDPSAADRAKPSEGSDLRDGGVATVDDHEGWDGGDPEDSSPWGRALRMARVGLGREPGLARSLAKEWALAALRAGALAGSATESIGAADPERWRPIDWDRLLERHAGASTVLEPRLHVPPRWDARMAGIVPGKVRAPRRLRVLAAIDTSSSMRPGTIASVDREIRRIAENHDVTVVECDAGIRRRYAYRGSLGDIEGRGGTDLRPPLEAEILRSTAADVVVYFTDGGGPAPETQPPVPVIWCIAPGGSRPAPWGAAVWAGGGGAGAGDESAPAVTAA